MVELTKTPKTSYRTFSPTNTPCWAQVPCVAVCPVLPVLPKPRVLAVVNGPRPDSVLNAHGCFAVQVREALTVAGLDPETVAVDAYIAYETDATPLPENPDSQYTCVVLGGSKFDVTDNAPWMLAMADWLRRYIDRVPILGICFGHQIIAHALGGAVKPNPHGWERGTYSVRRRVCTLCESDPLADQLPDAFGVQLQHGQSVMDLPAGAVSLYGTPCDGNQFVRFRSLVYGVQFHPEFDAATLATYFEACSVGNINCTARHATIDDTALATSIIPRFVQLAITSQITAALAPAAIASIAA